MLRLIGMLIGSVLAIATLIVALGVPRLTDPDPEPLPVPLPVREPEPVSKPELADEAPVVEAEQPAMTAAAPTEDIATPDPAVAALVDQVFAPEETRAITAAAGPEPVHEDRWYAFWSPFRSELAANGFVSRLQDSTGIDYRVVKVKTGVYEVAFAYSDEADIEAKLERIAAATGLDMTGG
jgi:hypothetical protein